MAGAKEVQEKVLVLVKALPHPGDKHGETVCCAGVTPDLKWRRLFPIRFRHLQDKKFNRWDWVTYRWSPPRVDKRSESRHVHEESLEVCGALTQARRANFLAPIVLDSIEQAAEQGQTLALIRPASSHFWYEPKSKSEIEDERAGYEQAAKQLSLLDEELKALEPCPYRFKIDYVTGSGHNRHATCGDWETSAMFRNFRMGLGDQGALNKMDEVFNNQYPGKGMALAMGTHSRYPATWLLVGIVRLDKSSQMSFGL